LVLGGGGLFHSAPEPLRELQVEDGIGIFGDFAVAFEVVKEFIIFADLCDDEVDVLAGDFLESEVHAGAVDSGGHRYVVLLACSLSYWLLTPWTKNLHPSSFRVADSRKIRYTLLLLMRISSS
jgi:hypothetical protein